jgi:hypothetical protein
VDAADIDLTSDHVWDWIEVRSDRRGTDEASRILLNPPPPVVDEEDGIILNGIHNE